MQSISLKANAKLNLFLKINGLTDDNYHDMIMVNQSISLYDIVTISKNNSGISIIDDIGVPKEKNIMYKVAKLINDEIQEVKVDISLSKNIPMQAGLGGGSSDAGAVIVGLDRLYDLNLSYEKKIELAKKVGADVPFCTFGGSKYVSGIGDELQDIKCDNFYYIIIKPDENMPTKEAFDLFDNSNKISRNIDFLDEVIKGNQKIDINFVKKYFYNDFESVIENKFSIVNQIKSDFYKFEAEFSMMSGSGTTVYAIYDKLDVRKRAFDELKEKYQNIFMAQTTIQGVDENESIG